MVLDKFEMMRKVKIKDSAMLYLKNADIVEQHIVSIEDRAFLYGDGCFTTARLKAGEILLWERHIARLQQAISALRMNCDIQSIKNNKAMLLKQLAADAEGIVKIVLSRGVAQRGYAIPQQTTDIYTYFYQNTVQPNAPTHVHRIGIMPETLATSFQPLKGIKTLNRLEQVILKDNALQRGWDEALCFDQQQHLVEGIASNCFVYIDGIWCTPDLQLAGIEGVMRQEILARMQHYQIVHQIRIISQSELPQIRAGFFCNALHPMQIMDTLQLDAHIQSLDTVPCMTLFQSLQLQQLV